jgi:hypothetical protein
MELLNATGMSAGYTMGMEPSGREMLVVVVKGTYRLPRPGDAPVLHEEQLPLVFADTFTGEPGLSAPVHEIDFAPRKARCDVLLAGSAYAPQGRPAPRVAVGLRVATMTKSFAVTGPRSWRASALSIAAGDAQPFVQQPFSYDLAFGGVDRAHEDPDKHDAYMANPVGRGYRKHLKSAWVDGAPMPQTEELHRPVTAPDQAYAPMAYGPLGRGWAARAQYAGTYGQTWLEEHFPFLPPDFQEAYYQAAPPDQQIDKPRGGEEVVLANLTPEGKLGFFLPQQDMPVHFFMKKGGRIDGHCSIDTLAFEPDAGRFTISWRTHLPLKKNMFEVEQVLVGKVSRAWWRARELGKTYYRSLEHLMQARRAAAEDEA